MATRKPLVLVNGQIQQLQSGDTLSGPFAENDTISLTNGDAGSHVIGDVVYISSADTAKKAKADSGTTVPAIALATATIGNGASGTYQTTGILTGLSGLTAGAVYYLSDATAGQMTTTPPSTAGHYVQKLGVAISATEFMIDINLDYILL
jgi:hypothetical protein